MNLEIDPKIRFIVLYRDARFSIDRINKITGTSVRMLNFWRQRLEEGHNILDVQEGRGRKKNSQNFSGKLKKKQSNILKESRQGHQELSLVFAERLLGGSFMNSDSLTKK